MSLFLDAFPKLRAFVVSMAKLPNVDKWRKSDGGDSTPPHNKYSQFFLTEAEVAGIALLTTRKS